MANLKTRLVFLFTGRLPMRDEEIDDLQMRQEAASGYARELARDGVKMNGFFWKLYEMVITAQSLETLARSAERLSHEYSDEIGLCYQPSWECHMSEQDADNIVTVLCKKDGDDGSDADTE